MNNDPFKVFLQTQRSNQEINEIAALGKLGSKLGSKLGGSLVGGAKGLIKRGIPNKAVVGKPAVGDVSGVPGAGSGGITRALQARRARTQTPEFKANLAGAAAKAAKAGPGSVAGKAFAGNVNKIKSALVDPASVKSPEGKLRQSRVALAQKLKANDRQGTLGMKMAGLGKKIGRGIQSLDTPQNRALAGKAVKGIGAFVKQGGFSSGFNRTYSDNDTGYRSAGGILAPNRLIGVGSADNDQTAIDNRNARDGTPIRNSSLKGLSPTERRQALQRGAAD